MNLQEIISEGDKAREASTAPNEVPKDQFIVEGGHVYKLGIAIATMLNEKDWEEVVAQTIEALRKDLSPLQKIFVLGTVGGVKYKSIHIGTCVGSVFINVDKDVPEGNRRVQAAWEELKKAVEECKEEMMKEIADTKEDIEVFRIKYLGTQGKLKEVFSKYKYIPDAKKMEYGELLRNLKEFIEERYKQLMAGLNGSK